MKRIFVNDTTLRDGLQGPLMKRINLKDRLELSKLLMELGVNEIEAGIPIAGKEEMEFIERLLDASNGKTRILTWNRGRLEDIDASISCGARAVDISFPVSDLMIERKLRKNRNWLRKNLVSCIDYAKSHDLYVSIGYEDATRADERFLMEFTELARNSGADRIRIADTVGCGEPFSFFSLVKKLKEVPIEIEVHTHNDLGLATANALAGVKAGAEHVSVTLLGVGERAGNAPLEEVAVALEVLYNLKTSIRLDRLTDVCNRFANLINLDVMPYKPIVGDLIFTQKSGIHIDGLLKSKNSYFPFPPEMLGRKPKFMLGYLSGKRSLDKIALKCGITLSESERKLVTERIKGIEKPLTIEEICSLIHKTLGRDND